MRAIERIRSQIKAKGLKRGETLTVRRALGLKVQWEILDQNPLTGDVAWMRANRPDFEHSNVQVDGIKIEWSAR